MWTTAQLAAEARWDRDRLESLPGRCRGDALGRWGDNLLRRFGPDALARVRGRLSAPLDAVAPVLTARDWVPAHAQVAITEAIADEFLGGDLGQLYPLLVADTRTAVGRIQLLLLRSLGPTRALRQVPRAFSKVYQPGGAAVEADAHRARVSYRGNPVFENPTWRLLQLFGLATLLELADTPGSAVGEDSEAGGFTATATW